LPIKTIRQLPIQFPKYLGNFLFILFRNLSGIYATAQSFNKINHLDHPFHFSHHGQMIKYFISIRYHSQQFWQA
jgi:hypothetical protein